HAAGGGAVDPKSYLDQWWKDALAAAPQLVASVRAAKFPGLANHSDLRFASGSASAFAAPAVPARSQLLWAAAANPQGGPLQLAAAVATEAARSVDWQAEARRQEDRRLTWAATQNQARAFIAPLVPPG